MNDNLKESINRAIKLMRTPHAYENYISIKIKSSQERCCCFNHCWIKTYAAINEYIKPFGELKEDGDVLIKLGEKKYVLECHESGPEIILYGVVSNLIASSIKGLIKIIWNTLQEEKKYYGSLKVTIRHQNKTGKIKEEKLIEIEQNYPDDKIKRLGSIINSKVTRKSKNKTIKKRINKSVKSAVK
jgi:hypothetical protein